MRNLFSILLFLMPYLIFAQESMVFEGGKEGHAIYRIPAVISLPTHELLAFAEGRVNGYDDFGDINLVMKRSIDQGKTWSTLKTLVDYDSLQAGNPAPVMDLFDPNYPEGVVYLFYNSGNNHEYDVRMNRGVREVWMIRSVDLGESWEDPVNITLQVHRPNNPTFNPSYTNEEDWRHYANTPGHAFQFQEGQYQGRIFVAANHSQGDPKENFSEYQAHGFYSDDHGKSFQISESIAFPGSNESIAAELPDDRMIMSIRNQRGDIRQRILAYSSDGGATWDKQYFEPSLIDPVCQGSIISLTDSNGQFILAHSNNADTENPGKSSYTAYSDLVVLKENTLGIIYEKNDYTEIVFKVIQMSF